MGYETHLGFKLGVLPGYAKVDNLSRVGHDFRIGQVENVNRHRDLIENAEANGDPTRTITLRRQYGQKISRRLRMVKGYIREAVVDKDVLGLRQNAPEPFNQVRRTSFRNSLQENQELPSSEEIRRMFPALNLDQFEFARDPNKNALFMEWLDDVQGRIVRTKRENLDRGQVRVLRGPTGITDDERWSDVWVRRSYRKGLKGADQSIRAGGARLPVTDDFQSVMRLPVHAQTIAQLYTRNFQELRNLTQFIDREISRVLADGLAEGIGPESMARRMNSVVGGVPVEPEGVSRVAKGGIHRARVIARTETIRTYNESKLNRFQQFGIDEVQGRAEWQTAGDPRVCPRCEGMEGVVFTVRGARNLIPLHPQCLPGDRLVSPRGRIAAAGKRLFEGKLIIIETARGRELATTPNHPIFTADGFVPANGVDVGNKVIDRRFGQGRDLVDGENENEPSRIDDIVETFLESESVLTRPVPLSAEDFHGDGRDGDVAVIGTDRLLGDGGESASVEPIGEIPFNVGDMKSSLFNRLGSLALLCERHLSSLGRLMGGPDLISALLLGHPGPLQSLRLASAPNVHASAFESPLDGGSRNPEFIRKFIDGGSASITPNDVVDRKRHPIVSSGASEFGVRSANPVGHFGQRKRKLLRELHRRHSVDVVTDEVVHTYSTPYEGYVYNIETTRGYYQADGLCVGNCRCTWVPVLSERAERIIADVRDAA